MAEYFHQPGAAAQSRFTGQTYGTCGAAITADAQQPAIGAFMAVDFSRSHALELFDSQ